MYIDSNTFTINNNINKALSEAYLNEYRNTFPLDPSVASPEYIRYMTKSLIERGFLYENSAAIEALRKAPLETIFSEKYKNIFLYSLDRSLDGVYSSVDNVKNMGAVGNFDLLASMITSISARLFPSFETKTVDETTILSRLSITDIDYSVIEDEKYHYVYTVVDQSTISPPANTSEILKFYIKTSDNAFRNCTSDDFYYTTTYGSVDNNKTITDIKFKPTVSYYSFVKTLIQETKTMQTETPTLTDAEIKQKKIEKLIYKLNTQFYSDIFDACNITRLYVKNKSMYDIFDQIRKSDEHYSNIIKDLYDKIVKVLSVMYYTININALITQNTNTDIICYPYEIAKWFVTNNLSKGKNLGDFFRIKDYFVPNVVAKIFTDNFYTNYARSLNIINPVVDIMETGEVSFPTEQVIFNFAENLFNFRTIIENTEFYYQKQNLNKNSYQNIFGIFLLIINNFLQMFYMESYLSIHKFQVNTNVKNIIKAFVPNFNGIVYWDDIYNYIKLED